MRTRFRTAAVRLEQEHLHPDPAAQNNPAALSIPDPEDEIRPVNELGLDTGISIQRYNAEGTISTQHSDHRRLRRGRNVVEEEEPEDAEATQDQEDFNMLPAAGPQRATEEEMEEKYAGDGQPDGGADD